MAASIYMELVCWSDLWPTQTCQATQVRCSASFSPNLNKTCKTHCMQEEFSSQRPPGWHEGFVMLSDAPFFRSFDNAATLCDPLCKSFSGIAVWSVCSSRIKYHVVIWFSFKWDCGHILVLHLSVKPGRWGQTSKRTGVFHWQKNVTWDNGHMVVRESEDVN